MSSGNEESSSCIHGTKVSFFLILLDSETLSCMLAQCSRRVFKFRFWLKFAFTVQTSHLFASRYTHPESRAKCRGFFLKNFFLPYVIGQSLNGMRMSEEYLDSTDHLDYTCIQPAHLLDGPVTGQY